MSDFNREQAAFNALTKFLADAPEVARLFELAGLEVPPPIARVLGKPEKSARNVRKDRNGQIESVEVERPNEWQADWLWVDVKELSLNTLVLGILRETKTPLKPGEIIEHVLGYQPKAVKGSIYNVGPRLQEAQKLSRSGSEGWTLRDGVTTPLLYKGRAWGPKSVFEMADLAAHRRNMIVEVLDSESDGLMIVQLTKKLESMNACHAPVSKDLIKCDLQVMDKGGVVRRSTGHSRKWRLDERGETKTGSK